MIWDFLSTKFSKCVVACSLLRAATKLGQGNVFTGNCDSVHGGGVCLRYPPLGRHTPWADTPPGQTPPRQTPPHPRQTPPADTPPGRHPPGLSIPLGLSTPPRTKYAPLGLSTPPPKKFFFLLFLGGGATFYPLGSKLPPAYGQRAASMHPTGMHSCLLSESLPFTESSDKFIFLGDLSLH